jgi:hypothetical protein
MDEESGVGAAGFLKSEFKRSSTPRRSALAWTGKTAPMHWIVVDDDEERLLLVRYVLAHFDDSLHILCLKTPCDALVAFEAEPDKYEFILTDRPTADLDDHEFQRRVRKFAPMLKALYFLAGELFSDEEATQKGFCKMPGRPFPFAALQPILAPATLKHCQALPGLNSGLRLVCAG